MFERASSPSHQFVDSAKLPATLAGFVFGVSGWHQLWLSVLSVVVFLLNAAPLEVQRRIIDAAVTGGPFQPILLFTALYVAVVLTFGLVKLFTNIYRGWVGESATRALRLTIDQRLGSLQAAGRQSHADAVGVSMILAECEDVGNFVGSSVSVPVLEGGFLITVFVYLAILQPWMAVAGFAVLTPQIIFVPLIQSAINRRVSKRISLLRQVGFDVISASIAPGAPPKREKLDVIFSLNVGIFRLKFSMNFLMNLTYSLGIAAILGLGGWFLVRGETEIATVVTFLSAIGKIVDPWNDVVDWARDLMVSVTKYGLIVQGAARLDDARQW